MIAEARMGQLGFFDADKRLAAVVLTPEEMRKSSAGRKPLDAIAMFRMLVLQALNNLSDAQASIRWVIGCHSRDFCGWVSRTAFLTPPRSGCSARSLPGPGSLRGYSTASTSTVGRRGMAGVFSDTRTNTTLADFERPGIPKSVFL